MMEKQRCRYARMQSETRFKNLKEFLNWVVKS